MRRILPVSLVVFVTLQTACARDDATAPQGPPFGPMAQAADGATVPSRIAFVSCGPCSSISVMAADGSGRTTLARSTFNFDPAWSPDGQQIAWTNFGAGEARHAEIWVMAADGSTPIKLTNDTTQDGQPSWSPDGRQIAFVSRRDGFNMEIYVMNADGSGQTRLTDDPAFDDQPSWSPDGRQIAFMSTRDGNPEIYVMNPDGAAPTRITNDPAFDTDPSWSPDGRRIAFGSDRDGNAEIYVMNADGSAPTRLTNNPARDADPSWSPTGLIAFSSSRDGNGEIYVMADDGSGQTRLTNDPRNDTRPSWGPWLDQTPPQLVLPSDFGVPPERWFGALVGYAGLVSGTDDFDPAPDVVCTPPTPSTFPIGTTHVQCTATDEAGNTTTGAFSVTVRGQYEELAFDVGNLEGTIASRSRDGLSSDRLEDALTKLEAAREEFAQTPTDRLAAVGDLQAATQNLQAAFDAGEISAFGYSVIARRFADNSRLTADQAIAEAKARGGNAEAIADAEAALAKGDEKRAASEFADAVAQYRKACKTATGA